VTRGSKAGTPAAIRHAHRVGRLLIVAAVAATLVVPIVLGGRDALLAALHFSVQGYFGIFALIVASWAGRTLKLQLLLRRLGAPASLLRSLGISLATDFAFITTPGGVGGYAASVYYLRRAGASASGAAAITAADQGMDVLFFVAALPLAALGLIWSDVPRSLSTVALATSALIALAALVAWLARGRLASWLGSISFGSRWPRLARAQHAVAEFLKRMHADVRLVFAAGPLFLFYIFALTVLQQLTRYSILWLALLLLGYPVSFPLIFLLQVFVLQAASWTGVPSGAGSAELGLSATLISWVPGPALATALVLWRMATLHVGLIAGAIAIAVLARRHKRPHSNADARRRSDAQRASISTQPRETPGSVAPPHAPSS
jgi:uncharacterized protein (TIRG00374 family)